MGVGNNKIDYDAAPYVDITFKKCFRNALMDKLDYSEENARKFISNHSDIIGLENEICKQKYPSVYKIAERHTIEKTKQACESLFHNLNTLESRPGSICGSLTIEI